MDNMTNTYDIKAEPIIHLSMDRDDLRILQDIVRTWWINDRDGYAEDGAHRKLAKEILDIQLMTINTTISYSDGEA